MSFDPQKYLIKVKGGQLYLPVAARLMWLREEHPEAILTTEMVQLDLDQKLAIFRAEVKLPSGASATGYGSETERDFPAAWIEKGETKAIGRALACLGLGTAFALEMDEGERVADAPARPHRATTDGPAISADTSVRAKLRAEVTRLLGQDREALGKLPKPVEQMTLDEMRKTVNWLIVRAQHRSDVSKTEDSTLPQPSSEGDTTGEIEPLFDAAGDDEPNPELLVRFTARIASCRSPEDVNAVLQEASGARKSGVISEGEYRAIMKSAQSKVMEMSAEEGRTTKKTPERR